MVDDLDATLPSGRSRAPGHRGMVGFLEILGLWCLAVLQPLLQLVGQSAPFLLHHRLDGVDLAIWLAIASVGVPLALWMVGWTVGVVGGAVRGERLHSIVLAVLVVLAGFGVLRRLGDPLPAWLLLALGVSAVWLLAGLSLRRGRLRQFFALLSLALPVVLLLFWISPAAEAARASATPDSGPAAAEGLPAFGASAAGVPHQPPVPIVFIVFDELPLLSILDSELGVDAGLCPSFAALAETATWYRNARTVSPWTNSSIASILIGRAAEPGVAPTRTSYPQNLLTWLESSHELRAFELLTAMAPPGAIELEPPQRRRLRIRGLTFDSAVIAAHQLLPPALAGWLPPLEHRWGDFLSLRVVRGSGDPEGESSEITPWTFAFADVRERKFEAFLQEIGEGARPRLYFVHVMLPHMPFRYLPSGQVYGGRPVYERPSSAWDDNEWFALETYQRHLLQVGFVDSLIGRLRQRLETLGLWQPSLVVVTADHGASYWPSQERRDPSGTEHPEDIWRVPLFIKAPDQTTARVDDRAARTVDVLPTVAALLGRTVPWRIDGRSLLWEPAEAAPFAPDRRSLERKLALFDPAGGDLRWVRLGPFRELIGAPVERLAELVPPSATGCIAELDQRTVLEDLDPSSRYSPSLLTGELTCEAELPVGGFVLAAINGRVAGSGAVQRASSKGGLFAVMTVPAFLDAGSNQVELFLAWGDAESPLVRRVGL